MAQIPIHVAESRNDAGANFITIWGWKDLFLPPQPRTPQKQVHIQGKTTLSFGFMLESSVSLFAYINSLKEFKMYRHLPKLLLV